MCIPVVLSVSVSLTSSNLYDDDDDDIAQSLHAIVACSVRSVGEKAWKPDANRCT